MLGDRERIAEQLGEVDRERVPVGWRPLSPFLFLTGPSCQRWTSTRDYLPAAAPVPPSGRIHLDVLTDGKGTAGRVYAFAWAAWEHGDFAVALVAANEAARMGELQACRFVARMYDAGEGVPPDPRRAARWLRFAAERGHAGCQAELGRRYERGEGVPRNDVEACVRFTLAAAKVEHPDVCPTMLGDRERVAERLGEADREWVRTRVRSRRIRQRLRRTCGRLAAPFLFLRRDLVA